MLQRVVTREYDTVQIIVIAGCGGIGAYVAQHVGRLMYVLYRNGKGANLTLVDPDVVKEENLGRQLFCEAEIGQPKAVALARRYGQAWGLNTMAVVGEYSEDLIHLQSRVNLCWWVVWITRPQGQRFTTRSSTTPTKRIRARCRASGGSTAAI
jgi:hypothetical protein